MIYTITVITQTETVYEVTALTQHEAINSEDSWIELSSDVFESSISSVEPGRE